MFNDYKVSRMTHNEQGCRYIRRYEFTGNFFNSYK